MNNNIYVTGGGSPAGFPHTMHLLMTLFSCGMWLPGYLFFFLCYSLMNKR
jgi:hypothetical protein